MIALIVSVAFRVGCRPLIFWSNTDEIGHYPICPCEGMQQQIKLAIDKHEIVPSKNQQKVKLILHMMLASPHIEMYKLRHSRSPTHRRKQPQFSTITVFHHGRPSTRLHEKVYKRHGHVAHFLFWVESIRLIQSVFSLCPKGTNKQAN